MIEFFFLSVPANITYQRLKKPLIFGEKFEDYACWAFKQPLVIYSNDLKQKHIFSCGRVDIENTSAASIQQKWKYFVITRSNNRKIYCTSYIFYEKCEVLCQSSSFFNINGQNFNYVEFFLPKCLVLISHKPYFKLQTNLIKIHRQLRRNNPSIYLKTNCHLEMSQHQIRKKESNYKINLKRSMVSSVICARSANSIRLKGPNSLVQTLFNYYVNLCNQTPIFQKIFISSETKLQVLHVYNLADSIYRFNYFFHMPISTKNLMIVFAAILQEKQIIFTSNNQNSNLMLMETLLQMITPLKWEFMYVPNLPESMLDAAEESFMPYMVGIHKKYLERITTKNRVVVHVDSDIIEIDQPLLELPESLKNMFSSLHQTNQNSIYLEWQKQMRIRSILLVSTLLTQFSCIEKRQIHCPDHQFYSYFFEQSAMYSSFKLQSNTKANIDICQLLWMPLAVKIKTLQLKFQNLYFEALNPQFLQNNKQWTKYYFNNIQKRRSLKNVSSLQSVQSNIFVPYINSSSQTVMSSRKQTQQVDEGQNLVKMRRSLMPKKGIGFVSTKN